MLITPVILSGGSGARLWPLSRNEHPKQFLPLLGDRTMLQQTVDRLNSLPELMPPIFLCNTQHKFLIQEQVNDCAIKPGRIILEPVPRNTAPAVAIAAMEACSNGQDPCLLILPADHHIDDIDALNKAVELAAKGAEAGSLMTFGIVPTRPETGYGYIETDRPLLKQCVGAEGDSIQEELYRVIKFVEKPDHETACQYIENGNYLWNSGIFMFRASRYLEELYEYEPEMFNKCEVAYEHSCENNGFLELNEHYYSASPDNSIDYSVMERTSAAGMIALDAGWNDVGCWTRLMEIEPKDEANNTIRGDILVDDVNNSYIRSESRMIAATGIQNQVIVETADAVLVASQDKAEEVKELVKKLSKNKRDEARFHKIVSRPWGWYETVNEGEYHKVKRIMVKPGSSLSLQMHYYRAEHWVVVKGKALVTRGEEIFKLEENQSTYIPVETKHCLENPGDTPLEIIEVQSGSYLGEDDIVRIRDRYGRN